MQELKLTLFLIVQFYAPCMLERERGSLYHTCDLQFHLPVIIGPLVASRMDKNL